MLSKFITYIQLFIRNYILCVIYNRKTINRHLPGTTSTTQHKEDHIRRLGNQ